MAREIVSGGETFEVNGQSRETFDDLMDKYREIQDFNDKNYCDILLNFIDLRGQNSKFYLDKKVKGSRNLSSTSVCTYAYSLYPARSYAGKMNGNKEKGNDQPFSIEQFYKYILDMLRKGLANDQGSNVDNIDEFTLINTISFVIKLYNKLDCLTDDTRKDTQHIVKTLMNGLCYTYIFKKRPIEEGRHPYIYYKFICLIDEVNRSDIYKGNTDQKHLHELYDHIFKELYVYGKKELYRQIAFHSSGDESGFDVRRLIYSLLIITKKNKFSNNLVKDKAIDIIFNEQLKVGQWPIGKVVELKFVLGKVNPVSSGPKRSNDCTDLKSDIFSYNTPISAKPMISSVECVNDMLMHDNIKEDLKRDPQKLQKLRKTCEWIIKSLRVDDVHPDKPQGWYAEYEDTHVTQSWVAGHNLIFLKNYSDFLYEKMQDIAKKELRYTEKEDLATEVKVKWENLAESYHNKKYLSHLVDSDHPGEYFSALLYGPPGSGKTTVAKTIACKLEYGFVEITPGEFLKDGESRIIQNIDRVFKLLSVLDKTVVFFDEVDQLVELREIGSTSSRWIVTALLPNLQKLRDRKKVKFILATNHIDKVDHAIKRRGRIDLVLPMGAMCWKDRLKILCKAIHNLSDITKMDKLAKLDQVSGEVAELVNRVLDEKVLSDMSRDDIKNPRIQNFLIRTDFTINKDIFDMFDEKLEKTSVFKNTDIFDDLFINKNKYDYTNQDNEYFHDEEFIKFIQLPPGVPADSEEILDSNAFCAYRFRYSDIPDPKELAKKLKEDRNNADISMHKDIKEIYNHFLDKHYSEEMPKQELALHLVDAINRWLVQGSENGCDIMSSIQNRQIRLGSYGNGINQPRFIKVREIDKRADKTNNPDILV